MIPQQLAQTGSKSEKRKGGRYSLENTKERRDQVFKLHFDDEKSNREIAELMKVNVKTINHDMHEILKGILRTYSQNNYPSLVFDQLHRFKEKRKEIKLKFNNTMDISDYIKLSQFQLIIEDKIQEIINHIQSDITVEDKLKLKIHKVKTFIEDLVEHFKSFTISQHDFDTFFSDYNKLTELEKQLLKEKLIIFGLTPHRDASKGSNIDITAYGHFSSYELYDILFDSGIFTKIEQEKLSEVVSQHQSDELDEICYNTLKDGRTNDIIDFNKECLVENNIKTVDEYEKYIIKSRSEFGITSKEEAEDFVCPEYVKLLIQKMNATPTTTA